MADWVKAFRSPPAGEGAFRDDRGRAADRWLAPPLFVVTLFSTLVAGALLRGADPLGVEFRVVRGVPFWWPTGLDWGALASGAPYAVPFIAILMAHEWGHRIVARLHGIRVSVPFFIPFPAHRSVVGTLGAFVRLRSRVPSRRALLDTAIAGPLASFALSVPALAGGLLLSEASELGVRDGLPFVIFFRDMPIRLGEPLVLQALAAAFGPETGGAAVALHPLAFAGWLGLMLTFLNLLPLARLDGGHILHALDPARQRWWERATVGVFLGLGFLWVGWWVWAGVMVVLGRSRPLAPNAVAADPEPGPLRRRLAWSTLAGILVLLPPVPVGL